MTGKTGRGKDKRTLFFHLHASLTYCRRTGDWPITTGLKYIFPPFVPLIVLWAPNRAEISSNNPHQWCQMWHQLWRHSPTYDFERLDTISLQGCFTVMVDLLLSNIMISLNQFNLHPLHPFVIFFIPHFFPTPVVDIFW